MVCRFDIEGGSTYWGQISSNVAFFEDMVSAAQKFGATPVPLQLVLLDRLRVVSVIAVCRLEDWCVHERIAVAAYYGFLHWWLLIPAVVRTL